MSRRVKVLRRRIARIREHTDAFDEELCRVGRGTPCGEYLRRFWQPVVVESELNDTPTAIRILGEDLVIFQAREISDCWSDDVYTEVRHSSLERLSRGEFVVATTVGSLMCTAYSDTPGEPPDSPIRQKIGCLSSAELAWRSFCVYGSTRAT